VKYIVDEMTNNYLVSNDPVTRLDKAYVFNDSSGTYQLQTINEDYGLYPRITINKWDNSVNETDFSEVIYNDSMGWGVPDKETVFTRFKNNGWLLELFKLTYYYIEYGYVIGDYLNCGIDFETEFDRVTPDDLIFVDENNIENTDGSVTENNTIFCFKKSVFQGLI
jgi:hypothetical protein